LAGIFLLVCGVCLVLLGGGCTISALSEMASRVTSHESFAELVLAIALFGLAAGGLMIWGGAKLLKPRDE
jgi:hypothetical protein